MAQKRKESGLKTTKNKRLRLVLIGSERTFCDYPIFLKHLLVGLADESIPVALVCPPDYDVNAIVSPGVEVIRYPAIDLPLTGRWNRKILAEQIAKFKPTVLHCLCESVALLGRRLSRQFNIPYVLSVNSLQKRFGQLSVSSRRLVKIMVPAESIANSVANAYPRFAQRVEKINIGTFVGERSRSFCEPGRLVSVVTAHRLDNVADFEVLLTAARHLAIEGHEFMLVLVGGGQAEKHVRRLLGELGIAQNVVIVPRLAAWRSVLAASDIFVQPVASTAFNPFLLEAMSVGAAVAACKGGVDELIIEDKTAVVFDGDDEVSVRANLKRLFDGPELTRSLAKGAQEYLKENHSVSEMVSSVLQTYRVAEGWLKA